MFQMMRVDRSIRDGYAIHVRVDAYAVLTRIKGSVSNYLKHMLDAVSVAIGLSYGQSERYRSIYSGSELDINSPQHRRFDKGR